MSTSGAIENAEECDAAGNQNISELVDDSGAAASVNAVENDGSWHTSGDQKTFEPGDASGAAKTTGAIGKDDLNDDGTPKDIRLRCYFCNKYRNTVKLS